MPRFSQRSKDSLKGVHPDLSRLMEAAIINSPVDFTIVEGVRTQARQKELYAQGRTTPGPKVTNADGTTSKSNHQVKADGLGHAVDLYPFVEGKLQVTTPCVPVLLKVIADHIKRVAADLNINIAWGGDFRKLPDSPHFELK